MSVYNKVSGDYFLVTVDPATGSTSSDNVTIQTNTVIIDGNLSVIGDTTMIDVEETTIKDPFILLGSENTGQFTEVGILAQTDTNDLAGLRYNSNTARWEVSDSVDLSGNGVYSALSTETTAAPGGDVSAIQFKFSEESFGGTNYFTVNTEDFQIVLDGSQVFGHIETTPDSVSDSTVLYSSDQGLGDSGMYVQNTTENDELVAYKRARKLSLIL